MSIPLDTSPEAAAVQRKIWAAMTGQQRVELAAAMSEEARRISMDGIRMRHPEYSDEQVKHALFVLLHGEETVARVWGADAVVAP